MAWTERVQERTEYGRVWEDGLQRSGHFCLCPLHYEGTLDSGVFDSSVSFVANRINNNILDGWRVTQGGWHYALGTPGAFAPGDGRFQGQDGVVGFGGRQGSRWLQFRLLRVGYMRWATREWVDLGGAPTYNRANLSVQSFNKTVGPLAQIITVESQANWTSIWATPGGGRFDISWRINGGQLKEEITINQAAREWIAANRGLSWIRDQLGDQTVTANEMWFGFVFESDPTGIPRWYKGAILQDRDGDFSDSDGVPLTLRDAQDRFLALLPIGNVTVPSARPTPLSVENIQARYYRDGTRHFILAGVRLDRLAAMIAGPLIFDPTFDIANTNRDAYWEGPNNQTFTLPSYTTWGNMYVGRDGSALEGGWQWITTIPQGATISTATVTITRESTDYSSGFNGDWWGFDVDTPSDFTNESSTRVSDWHTRTTANTQDDNWANQATHTSPSLVSIIQEIVNRAGFGGRVGLTWRHDGTASNGWFHWTDYTDSAVNSADLTVTWATAGKPRAILRPTVGRVPLYQLRI